MTNVIGAALRGRMDLSPHVHPPIPLTKKAESQQWTGSIVARFQDFSSVVNFYFISDTFM